MKRPSCADSLQWLDKNKDVMRFWMTRLLIGAALAAVLALAFAAYLRPSFVFDLANRIILCF